MFSKNSYSSQISLIRISFCMEVELTFESHHIREEERLFARARRDHGKSGNHINSSIICRDQLRHIYYTFLSFLFIHLLKKYRSREAIARFNFSTQRACTWDRQKSNFRGYKCVKTKKIRYNYF